MDPICQNAIIPSAENLSKSRTSRQYCNNSNVKNVVSYTNIIQLSKSVWKINFKNWLLFGVCKYHNSPKKYWNYWQI